MELTSEDTFAKDLSALPAAPDFHTPTFGDDVGRLVDDAGQPGFGHTGATIKARLNNAVENNIPFGASDALVIKRQYEPLLDAINHDRGFMDRVSNPYYAGLNPRDYLQAGLFSGRQDFEDYVWSQAAIERAKNPGRFANLPQNRDELLQDVQAEQRTAKDYSERMVSTGGPLTGTAAGFAGDILGSFTDPVNILTSVSGFPAAESLLKKVLIEGAGNMAVDAAGLPSRASHYADIGEPMSAGDMAEELLSAGAFGAGIGGAGHVFGKVLGLKGHALVDEFHAANPEPAPTLRTAAAMVEDEADRAITNPFADTPEGRDRHRQALMLTEHALDARDPSLLPELSGHPEIEARATEDRLAQPMKRPFDMSLEELDSAIADEKLSDQAKLVKALGSEEAAKEFKRLDRARNSMDTKRADAASDEFDAKFGDLKPWQEHLVYGSSADLMPTVDELKAIRAAKEHAVDLQDAPGPEVARVLTRGMLDIDPEAARHFYETGEATFPQQVALTQIEAALPELMRRGVSKEDLNHVVIGAMVERGYKPADAAEVLEKWMKLQGDRASQTVPADRMLSGPAVTRDAFARAEAAADHAQHKRNADPEALKPFTDPLKKPDAFREQADDLARELAPPPEKPASDSDKAAGGETAPSPYGEAAPQIEALERLPQDASYADPLTGGIGTVQEATGTAKRQARMVERLRACVEGGE
jgi:hypothetical protein